MGKKLKVSARTSSIRGTYYLSQAGAEADEVRTLILRRRLQILVHSCIYYELNGNLISDSTWSTWAEELVKLQEQYPQIAERVDYAKEFKNFDGSTGFYLPTKNAEILSKARYLLKLQKEDKDGYTGHQIDRAKPRGDVIRIKIP